MPDILDVDPDVKGKIDVYLSLDKSPYMLKLSPLTPKLPMQVLHVRHLGTLGARRVLSFRKKLSLQTLMVQIFGKGPGEASGFEALQVLGHGPVIDRTAPCNGSIAQPFFMPKYTSP